VPKGNYYTHAIRFVRIGRVRFLTYNVHRCRGVDGQLSPERIARLIASSGADVACLQELDAGHARTGGLHQAKAIAGMLEMQFHFFPVIRAAQEEYGDAILSRYPLKVVRTGELPRPWGALEPRGALWVEIEGEEVRWQVINTHLGIGRAARFAQASALAAWIEAASLHRPVVFCGDLNSRSGSVVHALFTRQLRRVRPGAGTTLERTFPTWLPWICLDYIYTSPEVEVLSAAVLTDSLARVASDHFPVLADLSYRHLNGATGRSTASNNALRNDRRVTAAGVTS